MAVAIFLQKVSLQYVSFEWVQQRSLNIRNLQHWTAGDHEYAPNIAYSYSVAHHDLQIISKWPVTYVVTLFSQTVLDTLFGCSMLGVELKWCSLKSVELIF